MREADAVQLVPWFNDFSNRSLGPGGLENSLYISLFAVRRDYQGKGLGRDTMNAVMRWGDEKRWGMTLFDHEPELVSYLRSILPLFAADRSAMKGTEWAGPELIDARSSFTLLSASKKSGGRRGRVMGRM